MTPRLLLVASIEPRDRVTANWTREKTLGPPVAIDAASAQTVRRRLLSGVLIVSAMLIAVLFSARSAHATGGKIDAPAASAKVAQPFVISGWAVGFKCSSPPPDPTWVCKYGGGWAPVNHSSSIAQATFPGCAGNPPQPNYICLWSGSWYPPGHSATLTQVGNPADGPGVSMVEIWTCPVSCNGSNATYRGQATYGLSRPNIATLLGSTRMTPSGYAFTLSGLTNGPYQIQARMRSSHYPSSWNTTSVTVTVVSSTSLTTIETPTESASVAQPFNVTGWAIDTAAASGTGVDIVGIHATPEPGSGAPFVLWGSATLGGSRPAVGATYGAQFTNSGFTLSVSGKTPDPYLVLAFARSTVTGIWHMAPPRNLYVNVPTHNLTIDRPGSGTGGVSATGLTCVGGSTTQAVPCGASYSHGTAVMLTPQPDADSTFAGWGGACTGMSTCQVTMTTTRFVVATFAKIPTSYVTNYYHTDAIGSVRVITDQAGAIVKRHDYFPFGEDTQPLSGDPMRFGGLELDSESGLNYVSARYYRNIWGRFLSVDPIGGSSTNPQRWNGYAYALNNPLRFVDPTGLLTRETDPFAGVDGNPCDGGDDSCYDGSEYYCFVYTGCSANLPRGASANQIESEGYHSDGIESHSTGGYYSDGYGHYERFDLPSSQRTENGQLTFVAGSGVKWVPKAAPSMSPWDVAEAALDILTSLPGVNVLGGISRVSKIAKVAKAGETLWTRLGKAAHKSWAPPEGFVKNVRLPSGRIADAVNFETRVIIELKPGHARGFFRGVRQVSDYAREMTEVTGDRWVGIVMTY